MNIKIIANGSTITDYLLKKWGLSILINDYVLFDTFCSADTLKSRFKKYHADISRIRHIVLSHEHWDHTGGLWWILEQNKNINVYACKGFSAAFKEKVCHYGGSLIEVTPMAPVMDNIFTTGEMKGTYNTRTIVEQSLVIKENNTLAVVTGCSHPDIRNILSFVRSNFNEDIDLLLGGLHLMDKPCTQIAHIAEMFDTTYNIKNIAPFHCTGNKALHYFKKHMPRRFIKITEGDCFLFNTDTLTWEIIKGRKRREL